MADEIKGHWNQFSFSDLIALVGKYPTPFYLYDFDAVIKRVNRVKHDLAPSIQLFYAIKANPNPAILRSIHPHVDGADISSGGELISALDAGFSPETLSFAGPGKTDDELKLAVSRRIGSISVESLNELQRIESIASEEKTTAGIVLRINPLKIIKEFKIKMGGRASQFGIDEEMCPAFFDMLEGLSSVRLHGIHVYSGTKCLAESALIDNVSQTLQIVQHLIDERGIRPDWINLGGGFGIPYHEDQAALDEKAVCSAIAHLFGTFKKHNGFEAVKGIMELGRYMVGEAGLYVCRVVDVKESRGKTFCVLDGGMHHHLAASGNFGQVIRKNFRIVNLSNQAEESAEQVTLVGPLCTSIDIMGDRITLPKPKVGDVIGILNSGAYAYTASPLLFLSHKIPLELMVERKKVRIIRESGYLFKENSKGPSKRCREY